MVQLLPIVTLPVNRRSGQLGLATGNAFLTSSVSLLFLNESYGCLHTIIMGIKTEHPLGLYFQTEFLSIVYPTYTQSLNKHYFCFNFANMP